MWEYVTWLVFVVWEYVSWLVLVEWEYVPWLVLVVWEYLPWLVLVVWELCHVEQPQPLRLLDEGLPLPLTQLTPSDTHKKRMLITL